MNALMVVFAFLSVAAAAAYFGDWLARRDAASASGADVTGRRRGKRREDRAPARPQDRPPQDASQRRTVPPHEHHLVEDVALCEPVGRTFCTICGPQDRPAAELPPDRSWVTTEQVGSPARRGGR